MSKELESCIEKVYKISGLIELNAFLKSINILTLNQSLVIDNELSA